MTTKLFGLFCLCLLLAPPSLMAGEPSADETAKPSRFDRFKDPEDGWLDGSRWLLENAYGFLPVPIIITEPAVDNGLGVAGLFFMPNEDAPETDGGLPVTDTLAVAAAYTGNDSWLVGGQYFNAWRKDTRRYTGSLGYFDVNLDWYPNIGNGNIAIGFNNKALITSHEVLFRLGRSDWFMGPRYRYLHPEVTFDLDLPFEPPRLESTVSGLGLLAEYEKVDSRLSPTDGLTVTLEAMGNDDAIGSDYDFEQYTAKIRKYFNFDQKYTLALRLDMQGTSGETPFYMQPFVDIEGIPAMRYQGAVATTAEIRGGWRFHPRWTAQAFIGGGRAADSASDLFDATTRGAGGIGIRYLMARLLGLQVGVDVARGPEDTYFYIVTGNAWR